MNALLRRIEALEKRNWLLLNHINRVQNHYLTDQTFRR